MRHFMIILTVFAFLPMTGALGGIWAFGGTVEWFDYDKGFGFISPDDGGKDVFVHRDALEEAGLRRLDEGQKVRFDKRGEENRPVAVNVRLVGERLEPRAYKEEKF